MRNVLRLVYSWMLSLNLANNPTNEQRADCGGLECCQYGLAQCAARRSGGIQEDAYTNDNVFGCTKNPVDTRACECRVETKCGRKTS
jgi:hypothetical protein